MKKTAIFISLMIIFSYLFSQNTDFKTYQNDGKIYFNKNIPVYFWVSTTPNDNSGDVLMQSHATKKYANPMYLDTEGYNTLQTNTAIDENGKKLEHFTFKIYADGLAPTVNSKFLGRRKYIDGKFIYRKGLKIQLWGEDNNSGLENIYYSINNSEFVKYNSKIDFNTPGKYVFQYYAKDNTGNKSRVHVYKFSVE